MIAVLLTLFAVLCLLGMMTLGAVLLVKFVLGKRSRPNRILAASLFAPVGFLLPISLISLADGAADFADVLIGLGVVGGVFSVIFCWPIAHFATKKLDSLTEFDIETFT
ncbi:MAG: hypothetical protein ABJK59_11940 [Erythrobacter sp.]|uniref:hypothetical protein n=1 Tax=Erythrobacter sp. TaxID=1042 RepID=UPI003299D04C